jgi:tetratricopeptide (TPR) repeat protein
MASLYQLDCPHFVIELHIRRQHPTPLFEHPAAIERLALGSSGGHVWLATGDAKGSIRLADLSSATPSDSASSHQAHDGNVNDLAFSSDGRCLVSAGADGHVRVWDVTGDGTLGGPVDFRGHVSPVLAVRFAPEDREVISVGGNTARVWPLLTDDRLRALVGNVLRRNLTAAEWDHYLKQDLKSYAKTVETLPIHSSVLEAALRRARRGRTDEARAILEDVLRRDDSSLRARFNPALEVKRARARGLVEEARKQAWSEMSDDDARRETTRLLEEARRLDPQLVHDPVAQARCQRALGLVYQAFALERGGKEAEAALARYRRAVEIDPHIPLDMATIQNRLDDLVLKAEARKLHNEGLRLANEDEAKARDLLEKAHKLAPNLFSGPDHQYTADEVWNRKRLAPSILDQVRTLARFGEREQALGLLWKIHELEKHFDLDPERYMKRCQAQGKVEEGRRAIANLGQPRALSSRSLPDLKTLDVPRIQEQATSLFREALELDPELDPELKPRRYAGLLTCRALVGLGHRLAGAGRSDDARAVLETAKSLREKLGIDDPMLVPVLDPDSQSRQTLTFTGSDQYLRQRIESMNRDKRTAEALALYRRLQDFDPLILLPVGAWNSIAWFGCINGKREGAKRFGFAADLAVALAPEDGNSRDTRGLVRAFNGDIPGAIADFEAFIWWTNNLELYKQRRRWIDDLRTGKPVDAIFTPRELQSN